MVATVFVICCHLCSFHSSGALSKMLAICFCGDLLQSNRDIINVNILSCVMVGREDVLLSRSLMGMPLHVWGKGGGGGA